MQCQCGTEVQHGVNGEVSECPPWEAEPYALCWECENRLEAKHEATQQARLERAAERYHERF